MPAAAGAASGGPQLRPLRLQPRRRRAKEPAGTEVANNLVVLDERCAEACRNQTAIASQLLAEFHLQAEFRGTGNSYDRDMQGI